jgi:spore coat protein U-like protein
MTNTLHYWNNHYAKTSFRWYLILAILFIGLSLQTTLAQAKCSFVGVAPISFGIYDVFSGSPNNNGVGSLSVDCNGGGHSSFVVRLSTGQSNSYVSRVMMSGGNRMYYNLFTSAARTVVWGDHTGGSATMGVDKNSLSILNIFGQIPERQDVGVGLYTDNIIVTVDF